MKKVAKTKETKISEAPKTVYHGVGRRKKAVARVWITRGTGRFHVNGKQHVDYFDTEFDSQEAARPLAVCPFGSTLDIRVNVIGSGKCAQAGATKLGIARALVTFDEGLRPALREQKLLTVDARQKERKKYGQKAARRKFQFVKR